VVRSSTTRIRCFTTPSPGPFPGEHDEVAVAGVAPPRLAVGREVEAAVAEVRVHEESRREARAAGGEELPEPGAVDGVEVAAEQQVCGLHERQRDGVAVEGVAVPAGVVEPLAGVAADPDLLAV